MKIYQAAVGMLATNCYFVVNEELHEGVIVDPGADCDTILPWLSKQEQRLLRLF